MMTKAGQGKSHAEMEQALVTWINLVYTTLKGVFVSRAYALRFMGADSEHGYDPPTEDTKAKYRARLKALLDIHKSVEERKERIDATLYDLSRHMANHSDITARLQQAHEMTEQLWLVLVANPALRPQIKRLLSSGLTHRLIFDLVKGLV